MSNLVFFGQLSHVVMLFVILAVTDLLELFIRLALKGLFGSTCCFKTKNKGINSSLLVFNLSAQLKDIVVKSPEEGGSQRADTV